MTNISKTLATLLVLSIMINFAALGFIGIQVARDYIYQIVFDEVDRTITPELKTAFRGALRAERKPFLQALAELRAVRDRQHTILTADELDMVSLEKAQDEVRFATVNLIDLLQKTLRVAVGDLPAEIRRNIPRIRVGRKLLNELEQESSADETGQRLPIPD